MNPDLNKFEVENQVIKALMTELAARIQSTMPDNMRFSLFLFEEAEVDYNIFYCSTAPASETLPLIETWCKRQVQ